MLLGTKRITFLGLLLAMTVLLVVLGSVLESSTLFFLAGASFCIGIAMRESNPRLGVGFLIAAVVLSLILSPNKIYCLSFAGMGLYIAAIEIIWLRLAGAKNIANRSLIFWLMKVLIFNLIYIPIVLILPELFSNLQGSFKKEIIIILMGQFVWFIFDFAYRYFQGAVWGRLRSRIFHDHTIH